MSGNSRPVLSPQEGLHPALEGIVRRHLGSPWRQPLADHNRAAFDQLREWRVRQGAHRPLWLDSGCGTGRSSVLLAIDNPDSLVVGIDQSAARLTRGRSRFPQCPDNLLLIRAECADLWRQMAADGWIVQRHFLLYPNPWPKPGHLARRWHGHPVLPTLLAISECLELRSNWSIYVEEMAVALTLAGRPSQWEQFQVNQPISDFEDKYQASGHALWRLTSYRV